jgi:hypothetical protein
MATPPAPNPHVPSRREHLDDGLEDTVMPELESSGANEPTPVPAVRIHIGGLHIELDRIPRIPRWIITVVSSVAAAVATAWRWR